MNEIQLWKDSEPLKAEIESIDDVSPIPPETGPDEWPLPPAHVPFEEHRACQRYPAVEGRSWLGWHEGSTFRQTAAWILNISATGCLVATDAQPPTERSIWLRLDNPAVPDWAEVRVVGHQASNSGFLAHRLVFRGACPYEMMKGVAFGSSPNQPPKPEPSRSWSFNSW